MNWECSTKKRGWRTRCIDSRVVPRSYPEPAHAALRRPHVASTTLSRSPDSPKLRKGVVTLWACRVCVTRPPRTSNGTLFHRPSARPQPLRNSVALRSHIASQRWKYTGKENPLRCLPPRWEDLLPIICKHLQELVLPEAHRRTSSIAEFAQQPCKTRNVRLARTFRSNPSPMLHNR